MANGQVVTLSGIILFYTHISQKAYALNEPDCYGWLQ